VNASGHLKLGTNRHLQFWAGTFTASIEVEHENKTRKQD